jgi:hypothetical protein
MPSFVRYGLILAAIGIVASVIGWVSGLDVGYTAGIWGIAAIVASIVVLLRALKEHRAEVAGANGDYTFMQGFVEALKINAVSYVVGIIWQFVFFSFLNTDYMARNKEWMSSTLEKSGASDEVIQAQLAQFDKTPAEQVFSPTSLGFAVVFILIYCAIMAAVVRREKKLE